MTLINLSHQDFRSASQWHASKMPCPEGLRTQDMGFSILRLSLVYLRISDTLFLLFVISLVKRKEDGPHTKDPLTVFPSTFLPLSLWQALGFGYALLRSHVASCLSLKVLFSNHWGKTPWSREARHVLKMQAAVLLGPANEEAWRYILCQIQDFCDSCFSFQHLGIHTLLKAR